MQKNHAKRTALALFLLFAVTVSAQAAKTAEVIPIGHTVGIKMQAEGVLIVQLTEVQGADGTHSPAKEAGVQEGDVLCRAGETALHSNDDLQKQVALSAGQPIKLTLERGDAEKSVTVTPCRDKTGAYRIGVLARDSLAGIGTLTYVDPQTGAFGSLGHGICDSETGVLLPLQEGTIIHSTVSSVQRGKAGEPGSLQGEFSTEKALGTVVQNTESGIRTYEKYTRNTLDISAVPVLKRMSHLPVVVDPSHAGGIYWMVEPLAKAAVAAGADGLMIEVHNDPAHALSDGAQSLTYDSFHHTMNALRAVAAAVDREI